jgi:NAD(P)-dependent dehydrogenase (short-subunit alcohol dehydrogenase family)
MTYSFGGRCALVTGAGSGIGRSAALKFAQHELAVVVCDVNEAAGDATARQIEDAGGTALFVRCDVSDEMQVESLIAAAVDWQGQLDYAFNNAGVHELPKLAEIVDAPADGWRRTIEINLIGAFLCTKYELIHMRERRAGAIVNTASRNGLVGSPWHGAYTASKHGVVGLTRVAAVENARRGIRINAVCPGPVTTPMMLDLIGDPDAFDFEPMTPAARPASPDEIAEAALWLCSDGASYVNGHALAVDGGAGAR